MARKPDNKTLKFKVYAVKNAIGSNGGVLVFVKIITIGNMVKLRNKLAHLKQKPLPAHSAQTAFIFN